MSDNIGNRLVECDGVDTGCNPSYWLLGSCLSEENAHESTAKKDYTLGSLAAKIVGVSPKQLEGLFLMVVETGRDYSSAAYQTERS